MKHPNILGIDFVKQKEHYIFLILPFSVGGDLRELIQRKVKMTDYKLEEEQILFWAVQIISAFGYLHERKIVHRDVKTANMLVDGDANVVVCDFGLAH
jgi:serine/threonine protein kinase